MTHTNTTDKLSKAQKAKIIATMIHQGRRSDEIAASVGVKEHFILAEMKARSEAEAVEE